MTLYSISSVTNRQTNIQTLRSYIRTSVIRTEVEYPIKNPTLNEIYTKTAAQAKSKVSLAFRSTRQLRLRNSCHARSHTLQNWKISSLHFYQVSLLFLLTLLIFILQRSKGHKLLSSKGSLISESHTLQNWKISSLHFYQVSLHTFFLFLLTLLIFILQRSKGQI